MKIIKYILHYVYVILKLSNNYVVYERYRKKYNISPTFRFNGNGIILSGDGDITIGENTYIGEYSSIQSVEGCSVLIGRDCAISHNVRLYTSNYDTNEIIFENMKNKTKNGNVIIGDNCWIGVNVLITEGVTIGSNVVIGGNSVVTKNIPSNCVIGGVPARIIKINDNKE